MLLEGRVMGEKPVISRRKAPLVYAIATKERLMPITEYSIPGRKVKGRLGEATGKSIGKVGVERRAGSI